MWAKKGLASGLVRATVIFPSQPPGLSCWIPQERIKALHSTLIPTLSCACSAWNVFHSHCKCSAGLFPLQIHNYNEVSCLIKERISLDTESLGVNSMENLLWMQINGHNTFSSSYRHEFLQCCWKVLMILQYMSENFEKCNDIYGKSSAFAW